MPSTPLIPSTPLLVGDTVLPRPGAGRTPRMSKGKNTGTIVAEHHDGILTVEFTSVKRFDFRPDELVLVARTTLNPESWRHLRQEAPRGH